MSANDNAASALDLVRAIDGAIDLIITDFVCAATVGVGGVCVHARLREPGGDDGMPMILRAGVRVEINKIRLPAEHRARPLQDVSGADPSQLSLFAWPSSQAST